MKNNLFINFKKEDIVCRCCGRIGNNVNNLRKLIKCLEKLYKIAGKRPIITSAYRCPEHNEKIGGVPNSYHCKNMAVDLWIPGKSLNQSGRLAQKAGFTGIGKYWGKGFIHCDTGSERSWSEE